MIFHESESESLTTSPSPSPHKLDSSSTRVRIRTRDYPTLIEIAVRSHGHATLTLMALFCPLCTSPPSANLILIQVHNVVVLTGVWGQTNCPAIPERVEEGRRCTKRCNSDEDCRGPRERCRCDDVCGMTCFNPGEL